MLWTPPGLQLSRGAIDAAAAGGGFAALTPPTLTADNVFVIDENDVVLYEDEPDEVKELASLSKLMTMMLAVDHLGNLDTTDLTAVTADTGIGSTNAGLLNNDVLSVRDAIIGAAVPSGNDCANALGRYINQALGGLLTSTTTHCVPAMNTKAAALGMSNTTFDNVHGGTVAENMGSARDAALMLKEVIANYPDVLAAISDRTHGIDITGGRTTTLTVSTTNAMFGEAGVLSAKTGTTGATKGNLALRWKAPTTGEEVVAVVIDATDATTRFTDMRILMKQDCIARVEWNGGVAALRDDFVPQSLFSAAEKGHIFDPSDLRSMWTDVNGDTLVTADGQTVKRLGANQQSSHNLQEATNGPTYNTAGGLHWLTYDGSNDILAAAVTGNTTQDIGFLSVMFAVEVVDTAAIRCPFRYLTAGSNSRASCELDVNDKWVITARRLDADTLATTTGATTQGAGKRMVLCEYNWAANSAVLSLWNGSAFASEATIASISTTGNTQNLAAGMQLGTRVGAVATWNGKIYGLVSEARVWTAPEKANLAAWMVAKAGI